MPEPEVVMSGERYTPGQIAQLYEVESALFKRTGLGLGRALQDLIDWARNDHGRHCVLSTDQRIRQAVVCWGRARLCELFGSIGHVSPEEYVNGCPAKGIEPIPPIPIIPNMTQIARFQYPVLVDERFIGMTDRDAVFKAFGAELYPAYQNVHDVDPDRPEKGRVYWMYVQDGRVNHGRVPQECIDELDGREKPLTDFQGLCTVLQFPAAPDKNIMCLAGSAAYFNEGQLDASICPVTLIRAGDRWRPSWTLADEFANPEVGVATGIIGGFDSE